MILSKRGKAVLQALFVTVLWSLSWVLIKKSIHEIPPLTFAGLRYFTAFLVLLPNILRQRMVVSSLKKQEWFMLGILGLVFYTMTQGGQFLTLKFMDAVSFSMILNFTSVIVAVFGIVFIKEFPTKIQWIGIGIFLTGVVLYFSGEVLGSGNTLGLILAVFTVSANAGASLLGRSINRSQHIPAIVVTVISMGIGSVVLLISGLLVEGWPQLSWQNIGVILFLAVVNTALAFTLWNKSLQVLSSVESSMINNTMLIQISFLAWLFLGEKISLINLWGLFFAAGGIFLTNFKSKGKR